jgi:hypothetical protein
MLTKAMRNFDLRAPPPVFSILSLVTYGDFMMLAKSLFDPHPALFWPEGGSSTFPVK